MADDNRNNTTFIFDKFVAIIVFLLDLFFNDEERDSSNLYYNSIIHTDISTVSKGPSMGAILIGGSIHAHECKYANARTLDLLIDDSLFQGHDCKSLALLWGPSSKSCGHL